MEFNKPLAYIQSARVCLYVRECSWVKRAVSVHGLLIKSYKHHLLHHSSHKLLSFQSCSHQKPLFCVCFCYTSTGRLSPAIVCDMHHLHLKTSRCSEASRSKQTSDVKERRQIVCKNCFMACQKDLERLIQFTKWE